LWEQRGTSNALFRTEKGPQNAIRACGKEESVASNCQEPKGAVREIAKRGGRGTQFSIGKGGTRRARIESQRAKRVPTEGKTNGGGKKAMSDLCSFARAIRRASEKKNKETLDDSTKL